MSLHRTLQVVYAKEVLFMDYLKYLVLISQVGLSIAIPMVGSIWIGGILDRRFHGRGMIALLLFILGIGVGCMNAYKLIMHAVDRED